MTTPRDATEFVDEIFDTLGEPFDEHYEDGDFTAVRYQDTVFIIHNWLPTAVTRFEDGDWMPWRAVHDGGDQVH